MSMTFKYKRIDRPAPLNAAHSPMIPVTLKAERELNVLALLDSGADTAAFSKDIADIIGADLSGERETVDGIGGHVEAVESRITIVVQQGHEKYFIQAPVKVILGDHEENFPIILGREGFFHGFHITFKEDDRRIVLKKV